MIGLVVGGVILAVFAGWRYAGTASTAVASADIIAQGRQIYADQCAACHGAELEGQPGWRSPLPSGRLPAPQIRPSAAGLASGLACSICAAMTNPPEENLRVAGTARETGSAASWPAARIEASAICLRFVFDSIPPFAPSAHVFNPQHRFQSRPA